TAGATRLGAPAPGGDLPPPAAGVHQEAKVLDRNYSNRNGFDSRFVPGIDLDLAAIVAPVRRNIAPLLSPNNRPLAGELTYENFSVVMDRTHRIAMLTATNIDGRTYQAIDRDTGLLASQQPRPEGDTWYKDPRINELFTLNNDFFGDWSN